MKIIALFRRATSVALAAAGLATASTLHAQMLVNNSFENPALAAGSEASGSGASWTASSGAFVFTNGYDEGTTPYGNQWEYLTANATDAQTVSGFQLNTNYTVSLEAASVFGNMVAEGIRVNAVGDALLTLTISGGATATATFDIADRSGGGNPGPLPFTSYVLGFTPTTNAPVVFTFSVGSSASPLALDEVLIVPEPSTWALSGLGGAVLLGLGLRRRLRSV